jgi:integral membrane protein
VSRTAIAYRVVAWIVGLNLIFVIGAWLAQLSTDETSWWNRHDGLISTVDMIHGYLFMALLVLIAVLARRHRWQPLFVLTTALFATIPVVSFWAERRATRALRTPAPV